MTDGRIGKINRISFGSGPGKIGVSELKRVVLADGQGTIRVSLAWRVILKSSTVSTTNIGNAGFFRLSLFTDNGLLGTGGLYRLVLRDAQINFSGIWRIVLRTPHNPHRGQMILGAL